MVFEDMKFIPLKDENKLRLVNKCRRLEKRGYECQYPIQTRSGKPDQYSEQYRTFYFTTMKKVGS